MERVSKSRAAPILEESKLEIGDLVDFSKPGKAPKDVPNWKGPATVVSATALETSTLTLIWQGRDLAIRATDVRRAILYVYSVTFVSSESDPAQTLIDFAHGITEDFEHLGWAST